MKFNTCVGWLREGFKVTSQAITCVLAAATIAGALAAGSGSLPQRLYVVDTDHQDQDNKAQILVLDPQRKAILKSYRAGYHPDLALSSDGRRLYLSFESATQGGGVLQVIDTSTDAIVASVPDPDRFFDTFDDLVPHMALSADGGLLYVLRVKDLGNGENAYGVAVFDTDKNKFLPDLIALPRCEASLIIPSSSGRSLAIICQATREVRVARFNGHGVPLTRLPLGLLFGQNENPQTEIATAFASGDNEITVIFSDGGYSRITLRENKPVQSGMISFSPSLKTSGSMLGPYMTSLVNGKVFLVVAAAEDYRSSGLANAIAVLDAKSLQPQELIQTPEHFSSLSVGADGTMFLANPRAAKIHLLALPGGNEIGTINGVGVTPTLSLPFP